MVPTLAPLLAGVVAATGTLSLGFRGEARGVAGPRGTGGGEPLPYEAAPSISLSIDSAPHDQIVLRYEPRLVLESRPAGGNAVSSFHSGSVAASIGPEPGLRLSFFGSGAYGLQEVSALSQVAPPVVGASSPGPEAPAVQAITGVRVAHTATLGTGGGADWRASRSLQLGAYASFTRSGGIGDAARVIFPLVATVTAESHVGYSLSARDQIGVRLDMLRSLFPGVSATIVWDARTTLHHRFSLRAEAFGGLGGSMASPAGGGAARLQPAGDAGLRLSRALGRYEAAVNAALRYESSVDPFSNQIQERLGTKIEASLVPHRGLGFALAAGTSSAVEAGRLRSNVASAGLTTRYQAGPWNLGLLLRAGFQERSLPAAAPWQWGLGVVAGWSGRASL